MTKDNKLIADKINKMKAYAEATREEQRKKYKIISPIDEGVLVGKNIRK